MYEFDQNKDSISVFFDEQEYFLNSKRVRNKVTKEITKRYTIMYPRNGPLKYVSCVARKLDPSLNRIFNQSNRRSDSSHFHKTKPLIFYNSSEVTNGVHFLFLFVHYNITKWKGTEMDWEIVPVTITMKIKF